MLPICFHHHRGAQLLSRLASPDYNPPATQGRIRVRSRPEHRSLLRPRWLPPNKGPSQANPNSDIPPTILKKSPVLALRESSIPASYYCSQQKIPCPIETCQ